MEVGAPLACQLLSLSEHDDCCDNMKILCISYRHNVRSWQYNGLQQRDNQSMMVQLALMISKTSSAFFFKYLHSLVVIYGVYGRSQHMLVVEQLNRLTWYANDLNLTSDYIFGMCSQLDYSCFELPMTFQVTTEENMPCLMVKRKAIGCYGIKTWDWTRRVSN